MMKLSMGLTDMFRALDDLIIFGRKINCTVLFGPNELYSIGTHGVVLMKIANACDFPEKRGLPCRPSQRYRGTLVVGMMSTSTEVSNQHFSALSILLTTNQD